MNIYSIKNEKLGYFNRPIFCESDAEARSLILNILMSDSDRAMVGLKGDLSLYFLGTINFKSGVISPSYVCKDPDLLFTDVNEETKFSPILICSLDDLFEMIPKEKLKPAVTRDEVTKLSGEIESLLNGLMDLSDRFNHHSHTHKKGVVKIESNS